MSAEFSKQEIGNDEVRHHVNAAWRAFRREAHSAKRVMHTVLDKQEDLALMRWEDEGGPCVSA
jgi:hypothetical protein